MKTVVCVIIYDRFFNLVEWLRCWAMCETQDAELVIIHNYANEPDRESYTGYCAERNIKYIPRTNVGFDIGAFQDICRNRLEGFPDFDYLIWVTDDCLPMRKDLVYQYVSRMKPNMGVVAMHISGEHHKHIRTTGFCVTKEVCNQLQFPADPITTKEQCYHFEHRGKRDIFMQQVMRMGKQVTQLTPVDSAMFWDSGFRKYKSREKEHYSLFPRESQSNGKVAFICPVYNSYPEIISSLINQTHKNWHLFLIHDGPSSMDIKSIVNATKDPRITYVETPERQGNWGHGYRKEYLQKLKDSDFEYIVITNGDNHHAPVYCEYMLKGFTNGQVGVYHSQMVHSYLKWQIINCKLQQGYLDCAGMMIRKDAACESGWPNIEAHSADWMYFDNIIKKYGADKFARVEGCLLIHN